MGTQHKIETTFQSVEYGVNATKQKKNDAFGLGIRIKEEWYW